MIRGISKSTLLLVLAILTAMLIGAQIANYIGPEKVVRSYKYLQDLQPFEILGAIEYINELQQGEQNEPINRFYEQQHYQQHQQHHHYPQQDPQPIRTSTRTTRRVSESLKKIVAHQQRYSCAICRQMLPPSYQVDHIIPLYADVHGTQSEYLNSEENLQALCPNCHSVKTQRDLMKYKRV